MDYKKAAEEVAKIISVFPGTSSEHGEVAGKVVNLIASHIALAERRGWERVRDAVDQLKNCNSQAHQESKHAGDCDWCEGFRTAARAACEGMGEEE